MLAPHAEGLQVLLDGRQVGSLARTPDGLVAFQYSTEWLHSGFSISPRSLPLEDRVFIPQWQPFAGLFGAFHDSLPDGWGAVLLDRMLTKQGVDPATVSPLLRLAIVGQSGRGGLCYQPEENLELDALPLDWRRAADERHPEIDPGLAFEEFRSFWSRVPCGKWRKTDAEWLAAWLRQLDTPFVKRFRKRKTAPPDKENRGTDLDSIPFTREYYLSGEI